MDFSYFTTDNEFETICKSIEEEKVENEMKIKEILERQPCMSERISDLGDVLQNFKIASAQFSTLSETFHLANNLAASVDAKISRIHKVKSNILECCKRVDDLIDLRASGDGIAEAMLNDDFEKAAAHVYRFVSMDQNQLKQTAADLEKDSASVTNSLSLMESSMKSLQNKITLHFKEAISMNDVPSVERFFKLFPLINMREQGIQYYSKFLCARISDIGKAAKEIAAKFSSSDKRAIIAFSDAITSLFEEVATLIEVNQSLVETYYGPGNLLKLVKILQVECDEQCFQLIREFVNCRQINDKIAKANEYFRGNISTKSEKLEPSVVDALLTEITAIYYRYQLYVKFVRRRVKNDAEISLKESEKCQIDEELDKCLKGGDRGGKPTQRIHDIAQELICQYLLLEKYYMEENIKKAIAMDTVEKDSLTSSMVDDIFFIVRKCIRRAYSSGNIDIVCTAINNACTLLETEVCDALRHHLKQGYTTGYLDLAQAYSVLQGKFPQKDVAENAKIMFVAYLNNSDVCNEYASKLCASLNEELTYTTQNERQKLESCLSEFSSVTSSFVAVNEYGLKQVRVSVVKPRIAPWVDSFLAVSHNLTDEEYSSYDANEPFIRPFLLNVDNLLTEFKPRLTVCNYESFVLILSTEIANQLEKAIFKTEFNQLGGLALDKEVRALVSFLSNTTSWSIREKFNRVSQISTILGVEKVGEVSEWTAIYKSKLSAKEIRQVLNLRKDLASDDIKKLEM